MADPPTVQGLIHIAHDVKFVAGEPEVSDLDGVVGCRKLIAFLHVSAMHQLHIYQEIYEFGNQHIKVVYR